MKAFCYILRAVPAMCAFLLLAAVIVRPAHAQLGIAAGLNFDSISDLDADDGRATFESASGYHIGLFYDLAAGPVALRPGIFYRQVQDVKVDILEGSDLIANSFDFTMIEVPIDLRLRLVMPLIQPYLLAGPVFGFASTEDEGFEDALQELTVSGNVGVGVEVNLPGFSPRLFPEIRYAFGISRFMKEDLTLGQTTFTAADAQRLNTVMLRLGIVF